MVYDSEIGSIEPNKYVVTLECSTYQDMQSLELIIANAVAFVREHFVETKAEIKQVIKNLNLQCGYCNEQSIAWIDWKTIGRPKGAPVCQKHLDERNRPDNFGEYPSIKYYSE